MDYRFNPQDDISCLELAKLIPLLIDAWSPSKGNTFQIMKTMEIPSNRGLENIIQGLPAELRRHFLPPA